MHSGFAQGCSLTKRSGECIHGLHACTWGRWQQRSVHRKGLSSVLGMERQSKSFQCQARKHFVVELQHVLPDCLCLVQPCSKLKAMEVPPNCKASRSFAGHFLGSFSLFLLVMVGKAESLASVLLANSTLGNQKLGRRGRCQGWWKDDVAFAKPTRAARCSWSSAWEHSGLHGSASGKWGRGESAYCSLFLFLVIFIL